MATADRCRNQRADEENPHTVLLREAEFRPQFLLGHGVRADRQSDVRRR
jgi:hypothetical protein